MTKAHLSRMAAKLSGHQIRHCAKVLDAFLAEVRHRLEQGGTIEIRGFGTFYTKIRKGRMGHNLKHRKPAEIPDSIVARFKFSPEVMK